MCLWIRWDPILQAYIDNCSMLGRLVTYPEAGGVHQFVNNDAHVDATATLLMANKNGEGQGPFMMNGKCATTSETQ